MASCRFMEARIRALKKEGAERRVRGVRSRLKRGEPLRPTSAAHLCVAHWQAVVEAHLTDIYEWDEYLLFSEHDTCIQRFHLGNCDSQNQKITGPKNLADTV